MATADGRYIGNQAWGQFVTASGTFEILARYRSFDPDEEVALVDMGAGRDTHESYDDGIQKTKITLKFMDVDSATGAALRAAFAPRTRGTLTWAPHGTASGSPKRTAPVIVKKRNWPLAYKAETVITVEFEAEDAIVDSTW